MIRLRRIGDIVMTTPALTALREGLPSARIRERYHAAIDLHGGPTAALLTVCTRAERKIGYKIKYKSVINNT